MLSVATEIFKIVDQKSSMMEDAYYLREELLDADSTDEFSYEEVPVDEPADISSGEEDLCAALQNVKTTQPFDIPSKRKEPLPSDAHTEVVEDFVRNYLVRNNLLETAEVFQREWYEHAHSGLLKSHQTQHLSDIYAQNRSLESALEEVTAQLECFKEAARLAKEKYVRLQKERDYHRMHHRRVVQEKNKLLTDLKRMKAHYSTYEPVMQQLRHKYQAVTREKMLASLERDRAVSEVGCLQTTLQSVQQDKSSTEPQSSPSPTKAKVHSSDVPPEPPNPYRQTQQPVCAHLTRTAGFQPSSVLTTHDYPVSSLSLHPSKPLLVTGSDDHTWKLWAISSDDLLLSGEGHSDWLSSVQCSPTGTRLATASGDGSVKLWDFESASCLTTFTDHQQPVWDCSWHWDNVFLASGGMDHTVKVWDTNRCVCVCTMRGHADSVNALGFMVYSNTLLTASADKTISLWDLRSGLCALTLYGHAHSCNDVEPSLQGIEVYSCDCFGGLIQWDVRSRAAVRTWELGHHSINSVTVDPAGSLVCCASDEGSVKIVETSSDKEWNLRGEGRILNTVLNKQADTLFSANSYGVVTVWQ